MRCFLSITTLLLLSAADSVNATDAPMLRSINEDYALHLLAIGDWGVTLDGASAVKNYKKEAPKDASYYRNYHAQRNVGLLMGETAERLHPMAVLGHGDSFYWSGLGPDDVEARFESTFEQIYDHHALHDVPWFNVMGNHDYGGTNFICDHECQSVQELLDGLNAKFQRQQTYKSPNHNRWVLHDHYYKKTLQDPKNSSVVVDIFNVDMNAAHHHGAAMICCQCKDYSKKAMAFGQNPPPCRTATRGHPLCANGSIEMFDACMQQLQDWQDDSLSRLITDVQASSATWKVVHSHYGPHQNYHDGPIKEAWLNALKDGGVQLFINGHVHAEAHDYADFHTHFITNGAGGGAQSDKMIPLSPTDHRFERVWTGPDQTYGFFALSFGPKDLRAQFITFGDDWTFDLSNTTVGSSKVGYCHVIPVDGSKGTDCSANN